MGSFFSRLAMKYLGPSFFSRAAGTVVAALVAYLAKMGLELPEDTIAQFSESAQVILALVMGSVVGMVVDLKNSKKDADK
jgi:hypothetical protein